MSKKIDKEEMRRAYARVYMKDYAKFNYPKNKARRRAHSLKKFWPGCKADEAVENYNSLFNLQYGKCRICGTHQSELKAALCVDHCHKTGKVRGLLCHECNTGIGKFKDDKDLLIRAIEYLT